MSKELRPKMPRLEELTSLCKIIEQKSFSRAAQFLNLSQPAVSSQVKSLESEYGAELLHRDGFEIIPTESGQIVYEFACQILELYERSQQQIRELTGQTKGRLLIGASTGPGEYLLPLLLGNFTVQHPGVEIALQVADSSTIIDHIIRHQLELGVVGTERRDRHLKFEPFIHDRLVLVVYPNHPWAKLEKISYKEFIKTPIILQQHGSGATEALYHSLNKYNINLSNLNIAMELGLQESTKAAVRAGLGVTIISRLGVIKELQEGVLIEVPIEGIELSRDFYLVYRRTSPLTNLARTFLDFLHQKLDTIVQQIGV